MKTKGHIVALLIMPLFLFIISCGGAGGSDLAKALEEEIESAEVSGENEETILDDEPLIGDAEDNGGEPVVIDDEPDDVVAGGGSVPEQAAQEESIPEAAPAAAPAGPSNFKEACPDFNLELPLEHTFGDDGRLYTIVNGEEFITEFGAWGTHGAGHTGHLEGDAKTNWSIYIRPQEHLKEISSGQNGTDIDGDGICEEGETCGVTAEVALANAPWYVAQHDGMVLTAVTHDSGQVNMQDYVVGETMEWMLALQVCGINFNIFHIGQLSDELLTLLAERYGNEVIDAPQDVNFDWLWMDPIEIPRGMIMARPQVTFSFSTEVDGETLYYAHAQAEWNANDSYACDNIGGFCSECSYQYFSEDDQAELQGALDINLMEPITYGRFLSYGPSTGQPATIYSAAHGELCAADNFVNDGSPESFTKLSNSGSYTWVDTPMENPVRDYFAIFEIKKDGGAYQSIEEYYTSSDVDYMFLRSHVDDISGRPSGYTSGQGEVISIDDNADEGSFIVRTRSPHTLPETDPGSQYFAASYRLESDRLIVHWGESNSMLESVVTPDPIPDEVTCNGDPYFCYNHDFSNFYN